MLFSWTKQRNQLLSTKVSHFYKVISSLVAIGLLWSSGVGLAALPAKAQENPDESPYNTFLPFVTSSPEQAPVSEPSDAEPGEFNPAYVETAESGMSEEEIALDTMAEEEQAAFDAEVLARYEAELAADPELTIDYGALYAAVPEVDLATRHPNAGIWVSYKGSGLPIADLQQPYVVGIASSVYWKDLHFGANQYDWGRLNGALTYAINKAGKKTYVTITAGYCPELDFPAFLRTQIATNKKKNSNGCSPLQFWDPNYVSIYKAFIRAMADRLAEFDATDIRPEETDIVFVRAQVMAQTMETFPTDYQNWEWEDFNPAPNGRIYKVNLTAEIVDAYHKDITLFYQQELQRAYQKRGLTPPVAATKGATDNNPVVNAQNFINAGVWFDRHNNSPSPEGWRYDMVASVRPGHTRGGVESNKFWPTALLSQYTYWEILAALHSGIEFIGISAAPHKSAKTLQPRGPLGFAENRESILFGAKYAGHMRNPSVSPGAWIALRGGYPEDRFNNNIKQFRLWTNYDFHMTQYRPQDSVLMFGLDHTTELVGINVPHVLRPKKQQWGDEMSLCIQQYSALECEYLEQVPDIVIGTKNSKHLHSYSSSSLGKVRYCSTDAFCDNAGATTRTESMLWARRTDGKNGHPYMRFKIDDRFASSLGGKAAVRIVYLDQGTGKWQLQYDSASNPNKSALVVTKTNTGYWKEVTVTLSDVAFSNRQEGGTDISLYNMGDDDDIFHMIEVTRTNQANQNTQGTLDQPKDADLKFKAFLPVIR